MTSSERRRGEQRGLSPAATPSPSCGLLLPEEGTADGDDEPILARAFAALDCEKLDIGELVTFKTDELAVEVDLDPGVVVLLGAPRWRPRPRSISPVARPSRCPVSSQPGDDRFATEINEALIFSQ